MKKTFVALAALAAVGAASAQVSLTGGYTFGYAKNQAGVGGLYTDGASIKLTAVEDLGNGLSATAVVSAGNMARSTGSVGGEDASLTLAGGFGSVELASKETGDATGSAWLAPGYGLDSTGGFSGGTPKDRITYKAPAIGGLSLSASYTDRGYDSTAAAATNVGFGGGQGGSVTNKTQPYASFGADYAVGGLSVGVGYTMGFRKDAATIAAGTTAVYSNDVTLKGAYDAGVAKVAAAYNKDSRDNNGKYALGVSVPMGAVTLGLATGQTAAKTRVSSFGVKYDLSKSVNVTASFRNTSGSSTAANNANDSRVLVSKSF